MTTLTASSVAYAAADYMTTHGHVKFALEDNDGRVCLYGALIRAEGSDNNTFRLQVINKIESLIEEQGWEPPSWSMGYSAIDWNNMPERTQDEVVAMLRKAGEALA